MRLIIVLTLLLVFLSNAFGQSKEAIIKNIRWSFQKINSDTTLKIVKLENDDFMEHAADGGGELTGYFKNDTLCKMRIWVGISFGVRQFEYYFKNGQVFFIYETEQDYPATGNEGALDYTKLNLSFEGRYYLNEGKLFDIKKKGEGRFGHQSTKLNDLMADVKHYARLLKARLKRKK